VPVDVGAGLPLLDPAAVAEALGPRVRALVQVPLFGLPLAPLPAGLLPEDIVLIDDQAQAVGSPGLGAADRPARFAALSFYPTKVLGAAGDGGAVLCRRAEDAAAVARLGHHGASAAGFEAVAGWTGANSRLDAVQAAVLAVELRSLPGRLSRRRAHAARLRAGLADRLRFMLPAGPLTHNCSVLVALHPAPGAVVEAAAARGVELGRYYPRPLGDEPALAGRARLRPCPRAARFCAEALALPCREDLQEHEIDAVIDALRAVTAALGPHPAAGAAA
jgi:dTDP-4-amino-4,6-dideoxygalactose transaminase